ncbi:MAG: hypothetical protein Q7T97_18035 [Burkholderiaceae bacterium]|nr:hypothetical protein [Burkholderiaceae bacterium]
MSYCAGWKHKGSIYLLADTVAAVSIPPNRRQLSLGELLTAYREEPVEEVSLKLHCIAPGTVVACTGDSEQAMKVIEFLRGEQGGSASNAELLARLESRIVPFSADSADSADSAVALLVVSSGSDGHAELLRWTAAEGLDQSGSDFFEIGSKTPYHEALSPELRAILASGDLTSDRVLPVLTAIVQSRGARDCTIDMNVEGLIFGLRTEGGTVTWQEDTLVVLYDQAFASSTHVCALARDDELVVHSSDNDLTRVFASPASMLRCRSRDAAWLRRIKAELASDRFRYRVFISTSEKVITVIVRNDFERESRYLRLQAQSNGQFDLALSPELTSLLLRPLLDRSQGAIPFQLSVRED